MCAAKGSTNIDNLKNYPKVMVVPVDDISDCMVLFQQGAVDSVTGDDTVLAGFVAQDPYAKIVGAPLTSEPYGLGDRQDPPGVRALRERRARTTCATDGTWAADVPQVAAADRRGARPAARRLRTEAVTPTDDRPTRRPARARHRSRPA